MKVERQNGWWVLAGDVDGQQGYVLIAQVDEAAGPGFGHLLCEKAGLLGELASARAMAEAVREATEGGFLFPIGALVHLRAHVAETRLGEAAIAARAAAPFTGYGQIETKVTRPAVFVVAVQVLSRSPAGTERWYRLERAGETAPGFLVRELELEGPISEPTP